MLDFMGGLSLIVSSIMSIKHLVIQIVLIIFFICAEREHGVHVHDHIVPLHLTTAFVP